MTGSPGIAGYYSALWRDALRRVDVTSALSALRLGGDFGLGPDDPVDGGARPAISYILRDDARPSLYGRQADMVFYLSALGADLNRPDDASLTPSDYAAVSGNSMAAAIAICHALQANYRFSRLLGLNGFFAGTTNRHPLESIAPHIPVQERERAALNFLRVHERVGEGLAYISRDPEFGEGFRRWLAQEHRAWVETPTLESLQPFLSAPTRQYPGNYGTGWPSFAFS